MSNSIEIRTPELPESVADAKVLAWHKSAGESVVQDENLADLETDKVVLEVPAPADGVLEKILADAGAVVNAGTPLAVLDAAADGGGARVDDAEVEAAGDGAERPATEPAADSKRFRCDVARGPAASGGARSRRFVDQGQRQAGQGAQARRAGGAQQRGRRGHGGPGRGTGYGRGGRR